MKLVGTVPQSESPDLHKVEVTQLIKTQREHKRMKGSGYTQVNI